MRFVVRVRGMGRWRGAIKHCWTKQETLQATDTETFSQKYHEMLREQRREGKQAEKKLSFAMKKSGHPTFYLPPIQSMEARRRGQGRGEEARRGGGAGRLPLPPYPHSKSYFIRSIMTRPWLGAGWCWTRGISCLQRVYHTRLTCVDGRQ